MKFNSYFLSACKKNGVVPTQFILIVNIADQTVSLFDFEYLVATVYDRRQKEKSSPNSPAVTDRRYKFVRKIPCSTSRFGIGQVEGTHGTPLGLHRIAEKIGGGWPPGTVFKGRRPIGYTWQGMPDAKITTRILWLEGLEPGFNRGGRLDSHARYIYIHGTADQMSIGRPASCGCIHLADADLIPLFDLLPSGTLVWISSAARGRPLI